MNHAITYNKTLQERLQEYTDVLGGYEVLQVSEISREWAFFLEVTIDSGGWQAIWKIPRLTCQKLNIEFPTLVLVYVNSVCFGEFSANVTILLVNDEIDVPKKHVVPLVQLWPTEKQDESICLNLQHTANAIDMLRFFYINLLMPWDNEDFSSNWLHKHLESRLRLFYDLRNGTISEDVAAHIKGLLTEARHIQEHQQEIMQLVDVEEEINADSSIQSLMAQKFLDLRVRMMQIKCTLELAEDPRLITSIILESNMQTAREESDQITSWIVFEQGKIVDFLTFLEKVQSVAADAKVKFESTFPLALKQASTNDTIYLSEAKHVFMNLGNLHEGGVIKGTSSTSHATIVSTNEDIVLDCQGTFVLENLYIDVASAQCGILVRGDEVTLKNCIIVGDYKSSTQQGIIVLDGGVLHMDNCEIKGFFNGIVVNSNGTLFLNNSTICSVNTGLKCYDNSNISIQSTRFKDCYKYGIFMETDNSDPGKLGDFDMLLSFKNVKVENVTGKDNGKGNVKIGPKCQLEPISDLFSNSELNSTINHRDEEKGDYDYDSDEEEGDYNDEMEVNESNSRLDITAIAIITSSDSTEMSKSIQ